MVKSIMSSEKIYEVMNKLIDKYIIQHSVADCIKMLITEFNLSKEELLDLDFEEYDVDCIIASCK